ncbi:N-acyl-D-amino-acid deacylase family protein [Neptunicella sp. SCSIO 80796]|uniref:N-acyl-D-amino-acid deacylase family protein n=1 Tax=Neptunicella plasticusilytica TaxID=3117012 RepID=UPI003A4DD33A
MLIALYVSAFSAASQANDLDLLFRGARIVDGSGRPAYIADLGISQQKIVFIGDADKQGYSAELNIDARGRVLAPGFIDLHAHGNPLKDGSFSNFLAMGVTTIVLGQDGFSPAISSIDQWQQRWDSNGVGVNIALLIGHGSLRRYVGIGNVANISDKQLSTMQSVLANALETRFGLSTGLEYVPAIHATEQELIALAKVVGEKKRLIMSHIRNEDDDQLFASIMELARQGKYCNVHVAHIKSVYGKGQERGKDILALLSQLKNDRVPITADIYPYNASYTGIAILFPDWAKTDGMFKRALSTRRQELEQYLNNRVMARGGPKQTLMGSGQYTGLTLQQVADKLGKPFAQVLIDDIGPEGASAAYFIMDESLQSQLLTGEMVAMSSDGSPTMHHPRGYGSFAKLIEEYVINRQLLSIEQAVYKATGLSADILGITDRGLLKKGMQADLILFDPVNVRANASYQHPHQLASGFDMVLVNGKIAWQDANQQLRHGVLLKPQGD